MKIKKGLIIQLINNYIGVENGYLGNFDSYRSLEEFYPVYCDLDIDIYSNYEGTIRSRFKQVLEQSEIQDQIKIILGIFSLIPIQSFDESEREIKTILKNKIEEVIKKYDTKLVINDEDIKAHFDKIQEKILEEIESARFLVQIAVAWFTDPIIFRKLANKNYSGVTVELILLDDNINRKSGLEYEKYMSVFWSKSDRMMHHKYCVIDLNTCITGSYNWTNKAAYYNRENISIKKGTSSVLEYAVDFTNLKSVINRK